MYHVIIIEDDPMVASINKQYVEVTPEFRVDRIFKNGSEALPYLKTNPTDLIILDYYTPVMNGGEFLDALHNAGLTPSVIMVTSANDTDIVRSLLNRGITDYLVKPFEYTRFKTALDRFTETKKYLEHSHGGLGQHDIDRLFSVNDQRADAKPSLAKGLNETTLAMIREYLQNNRNGFFTSEQIAEQIHLSRITIRRYMNYMVDTGEIISTIDYKTGGQADTPPNVASLFVPDKKRSNYVFQTFLYAAIVCRKLREKGKQQQVAPALLFIHRAATENYSPVIELKDGRKSKETVNDFEKYEPEFREELKKLLEEVFNPEHPFSQTITEEKCEYCDFKALCKR